MSGNLPGLYRRHILTSSETILSQPGSSSTSRPDRATLAVRSMSSLFRRLEHGWQTRHAR
jgi:hypothetical protein